MVDNPRIVERCVPGPLDFLMVYQGSKYISTEIKVNLTANGTILDQAPIETWRAISTDERCHASLRDSYERIISDVRKGVSDN